VFFYARGILYLMNKDDIIPLLTPPKNWQWGEFKNDKKRPIRYGWNAPDNPKALIVIAEGRTECIEEYFEIIRDLNAKGYACAIMDWQGHGLSYRHFDDNTRQHSYGFDRDVDEFSLFLSKIDKIEELKKLPKTLMAHSMGGNITLRYMADNPDTFKCAYLVAPMLGLQPKRIIKYIAPMILRAASSFKRMHKHALGQTRWNETFANIAKHKVSSDPIRRNKQPYLFKTRPELRCGGVTFGWLHHALQSIAMLQTSKLCKKVTTPAFIAIAGKDVVVDNDKSLHTASLLPHCKTQVFDGAEHQIHAERDEIRDTLLDSLHRFFEKHL
jgi:lysophospholipase